MTQKVIRPNAALKAKDKARKKLWDNLLEVYEKEAEENNELDSDSIEVSNLEKWGATRSDTSMHALQQVLDKNPQLVADALPGAGLLEQEDTDVKNKKVGSNLKTHKKCLSSGAVKKIKIKENVSSKVESEMKLEPPVRLLKKRKYEQKKAINENDGNEELQPNSKPILSEKNKIQRTKVTKSIKTTRSAPTLKIHNKPERFSVDNSPVIKAKRKLVKIVKKEKREQKESESFKVSKTTKNIKRSKEVIGNSNDIESFGSEHSCDLKIWYFNSNSNPSVRPDGTSFNCKLTFKLCECEQSDEVF